MVSAAWDEDRETFRNFYLCPFRPPNTAGSPRHLSKTGELIYLNHGATYPNRNTNACISTISSRLIPRRTLYYMTERNASRASHEIPRILRNPKVHYRIHKSTPPAPTANKINPVHTPPSHFLKTHLRFGLPSDFFPSGSLKPCLLLSSPQYVSVPPTIPFFLIWSPRISDEEWRS